MSDSITLTGQTNGTVTLTGGSGGTLIFQGVSQGIKGDKGDQGDPATNLVTSVAGKTGAVSLTKDDVGLSNVDNTSDADKPVSTATQTALDAKATITALDAHTNNTANPHSVTKAQVGLGNVQNLAPADMPVSTDTQTALDAKANASDTVNLTGNQTVAGVKTFSSSPIVPTATTNTQAVNKSQMDTADALKVNKAGDTMTGVLNIQAAADPSFQLTHTTLAKSLKLVLGSINFGLWNTTDSKTPFRVRISAPDSALEVLDNGLNIGGANYLYGNGFPDGVVTAPVGSIYIDKAITNGASSWIKKSGTGSTGWQVLDGDTGWRVITDAFIGLTLRVRRVNGTVYHGWSGTPNITGTSTAYAYPVGFRGDLFTPWIFLQGGTVANLRLADDGGTAIFYSLTNATVNYPHSAVPTSTAWPSTLPGVSA